MTPRHLLLLLAAAAAATALAPRPAAADLLTPLLTRGNAAAARNLSAVVYKGVNMGFAGHYTVPAQHRDDRLNHIFTWYQPCRDCDADSAPLLLWLQGGPGGPGYFGAFGEIGNWYINGLVDDEPHERCFSWCITNHCLFVDQPVNTGFSWQSDKETGAAITKVDEVDYSDTSRGAMQNVLDALLQFYQVFPEVSTNRLVITGESYGGLYTPNLGLLIYEHNQNRDAQQQQRINFNALAIGDPCINWQRQMPTYADTMYGMGVIMVDEREELRAIMAESVKQMNTGDCPTAFNTWNQVFDDNGGLGPSQGRGWYAKKTGSFNTANVLMGNGPPGFGAIFSFWAKPEALAAFHVDTVQPPDDGSKNALNIYDAFVQSGDWCANSSSIYSQLLADAGIDLMIYSSSSDPLLGPPTTEAGVGAIFEDLVAQSPAVGKPIAAAFSSAKKDVWFVNTKDEDPAGYAKCTPNTSPNATAGARFCYTVVRNAGHETPGYQPRSAYDMLMRFLEGRDWNVTGNRGVPQCSQCSGVGPFAGAALPSCKSGL